MLSELRLQLERTPKSAATSTGGQGGQPAGKRRGRPHGGGADWSCP